jgi:hypothetical protein
MPEYKYDIEEEAVRKSIDNVAARLRYAGHFDAAARLELVREYCLNRGFRSALEDMLWARWVEGKWFIGDRVYHGRLGIWGTVVQGEREHDSAPLAHDPEYPYVHWDATGKTTWENGAFLSKEPK